MATWLLSTEITIDVLAEGNAINFLGKAHLRDFAISAVTFEWIAADLELQPLQPAIRQQLRTNLNRLREQLRQQGGEIPALSTQALQHWGRLLVLTLQHRPNPSSGPETMPVEERLIVATAAASGFVYVTPHRDWNSALVEFGISVEEI
jgi:hypothetical protein